MHYDNQYTAQYMAGESDRQVRELEYQLAKLTKEKEQLENELEKLKKYLEWIEKLFLLTHPYSISE